MLDLIDETYLPFTTEKLRPHFVGDVDGQLRYYQESASRYQEFKLSHPDARGIPLTEARVPRQIEKDERFWTITATKWIFDAPDKEALLARLLAKAYGSVPPLTGIPDWPACLKGDLRLYFEACFPSPKTYRDSLRSQLDRRHLIPYVFDAAEREDARALEGPTHVDALFLNRTNGFAWFIEAKVLSDVSCSISFDVFRNQIVRSIDVMLDGASTPEAALQGRDPERSLFCLLTPAWFKGSPHSRLYGWLMQEYATKPEALARDLSHRQGVDWARVSRKIGWLTFEDFQDTRPGACPWMRQRAI